MHGYQMIQEMERRSDGAWRPSPGSVYPTLSQLEDEGLVTGEEDGGKRVFALTEEGRRAATEGAGDDAPPWDTIGADDGGEEASTGQDRAGQDGTTQDRAGQGGAGQGDQANPLREEVTATAGAVMAVVTSGDDDLVEQARAILADTRRRLYRLLAEQE